MLLLTLSLLGLFALPSVAQSPDLPPQGALYLGAGKVLEARRPRQLTLNASVLGFLYQPGGLSVAYAGATQDGGSVTLSVRLVGLKRGEATTLTSDTFHVHSEGGHYEFEPHTLSTLAGWSGDGRYLLIEQTHTGADPQVAVAGPPAGKTFVCVDVGASPVRLLAIPLPPVAPTATTVPEPESGGFSWQSWWSPGRARLLFTATGIVRDGNTEPFRHRIATLSPFVYDPARQRVSPLALPDDGMLNGWLDEGHVLLYRKTNGRMHYFAFDVSAGTQEELPGPPKVSGDPPGVLGAGGSPKDPRLLLDVEERFHPDKQGVTGIDSHLLWVRRLGGLKRASALPVGLTPDRDDPQAQWSPTGGQIAFVSHGDLFVTDLSVRDADPREKLAAGDTLSCPEERALAQSNLKQIGLALMQYSQDYDEQFPPAAGVNDRVMPYLKNASLFSLGDSRFVYKGSGDLALANIDAPAQTVLGTLDTPCARNVLYADGHVESFPKPGK